MRRYVASSGPSSVDIETVRREIRELEEFVDPTVELMARSGRAAIAIDGEPRGDTPLTVTLPKGTHSIEALFEHDLLRRLEVSLGGGERRTIELAPPRRKRTGLWGGVGVGSALVVAAVVTGVVLATRPDPLTEGTLDPFIVPAQP